MTRMSAEEPEPSDQITFEAARMQAGRGCLRREQGHRSRNEKRRDAGRRAGQEWGRRVKSVSPVLRKAERDRPATSRSSSLSQKERMQLFALPALSQQMFHFRHRSSMKSLCMTLSASPSLSLSAIRSQFLSSQKYGREKSLNERASEWTMRGKLPARAHTARHPSLSFPPFLLPHPSPDRPSSAALNAATCRTRG